MRILLDTGPLVALLNRRDFFHDWSVKQAGLYPPPFYTCEAVLAEAYFLLRGVHAGSDRLMDLVASGHLDVSFSFWNHRDRIGALMRKYASVPMSFADACLVCMAEEEGSSTFTVDSDFRVYRIHQNERLKLIIP